MAIVSNSSEEQVSGGVGPLYVGIAAMKVAAVNPTLQELNDMGVNAQRDPEYVGVNIGGDEYNKVVFWLKHEEPNFFAKLEVLVKPEARVSQSGKSQWCNNIGQFAYADNKASEAYEWFKDEGVRKAFVGEETLMDFIKAYANVANGDECAFESWQAIAKGDVKEIKALIKALSDNRVRVLLGVKDEKYQQVYTRHFGRLKPKRDDLFVKNLNGDYGAFKAEYNSSLQLEEYSPSLIAADNDSLDPLSSQVEETESDWTL